MITIGAIPFASAATSLAATGIAVSSAALQTPCAAYEAAKRANVSASALEAKRVACVRASLGGSVAKDLTPPSSSPAPRPIAAGGPVEDTPTGYPEPRQKDNTILFVGGAAALLVALVVVKKKMKGKR